MSWTPATRPTGREPDPTPGIGRAGELDIVTVSEMLSDDRTDCAVPHHPSLSEWCALECKGYTLCLLQRADDGRPTGETCGRRHPVGEVCKAEHSAAKAEPRTKDRL